MTGAIRKIILFASFAIFATALPAIDKEPFYIEVLHKAIEDPKTLNVTLAMDALHRMQRRESVQLPVRSNGRNIIHHILDIYMRSRDNNDRKLLIDLVLKLLEKGARVEEHDDEDPDVLVKALIIRVISLANAFIKHGYPSEVTSGLLRALYSIPTEVIPLGKLLLQAHTVIESRSNGQEYHGGIKGVKALIASATLPPGAPFAVRGSDSETFSGTYDEIVQSIGQKSFSDRGVLLSDIILMLSEAVENIHYRLLFNAEEEEEEENKKNEENKENGIKNDNNDKNVKTDINNNQNLKTKSKNDAEKSRKLPIFNTEILLDRDMFGRNPLHILSNSGAIKMMNVLTQRFLLSLSSRSSTTSPPSFLDNTSSKYEAVPSFPFLSPPTCCSGNFYKFFYTVMNRLFSSICSFVVHFIFRAKLFYSSSSFSYIHSLLTHPTTTISTLTSSSSSSSSLNIDYDITLYIQSLIEQDIYGRTPLQYILTNSGHRNKGDKGDKMDKGDNRNKDYIDLIRNLRELFYTSEKAAKIFDKLFSMKKNDQNIIHERNVNDYKKVDTMEMNIESELLQNTYEIKDNINKIMDFDYQNSDDGGWNGTRINSFLSGDADRCDFHEEINVDFEGVVKEYFEKLVLRGEPVIFRGGAMNSKMREIFKKEEFLRLFGGLNVPLGPLPYAGSFGIASYTATISQVAAIQSDDSIFNNDDVKMTPKTPLNDPSNDEFISKSSEKDDGIIDSNVNKNDSNGGNNIDDNGSNENNRIINSNNENDESTNRRSIPLYSFSTASPQIKSIIDRRVPIPPFLHDFLTACDQIIAQSTHGTGGVNNYFQDYLETQLFLGPPGSGAPVHFHTHALNVLAYGEKRWSLFPPSLAFYSIKPALEFFKSDPRVETSLQCTQREGDIVYIPALWAHSTLNVKQSIGIAYELNVQV